VIKGRPLEDVGDAGIDAEDGGDAEGV